MLETLVLACLLLLTLLACSIGLKDTFLFVFIFGAPAVSIISIMAFLFAVLHFHRGWGLLVPLFGPLAFVASGAIGGPLHLSIPTMLTIFFGLWSAACLMFWLACDWDRKSSFFGATVRFWGLGLIVAACIPGFYAWHGIKLAASPATATDVAGAPQ